MPNILVTADLHLDLWKRTERSPLDALPPSFWQGLDALIVAGDLSNDAPRKWPRHLARLVDLMGPDKVFVLPGNHDYYGLPIGQDATLAALCDQAGTTLVQQRVLHFGSWRFLCATLWTDLALPGEIGHSADFRRIQDTDGGPLTPASISTLHDRHLAWLRTELAQEWAGETVVVTHHAPHRDMLDTHVPALFASDLGDVIAQHAPALWLCGHTHFPTQVRLGDTLVRNISLGGPKDITDAEIGPRLLRGHLNNRLTFA